MLLFIAGSVVMKLLENQSEVGEESQRITAHQIHGRRHGSVIDPSCVRHTRQIKSSRSVDSRRFEVQTCRALTLSDLHIYARLEASVLDEASSYRRPRRFAHQTQKITSHE